MKPSNDAPEEGTPKPSENGPRLQDPPQTLSQDPDVDYSLLSDENFGPLGEDEVV